MGEPADRLDVDQLEERIRGRLHPDHPGPLGERPLNRLQVRAVDKREAESRRLEDPAKETVGPAVEVVDRHRVVAGLEEMHDDRLGRHPGGERQALPAAFQGRDARLERGTGRVPSAGVLVTLMLPDRVLGEGRGLVDRHDDGSRGRVRVLAGVNRSSREPGRPLGAHRDARRWAMNSSKSSLVIIPTGRSASITTSAVAPASSSLKASST